MKESEIFLNPNELVRFLDKPHTEFTQKDIIRFIEEKEIKMLNFRYVGEDGKLKTLNFVISSKKHLEDCQSEDSWNKIKQVYKIIRDEAKIRKWIK